MNGFHGGVNWWLVLGIAVLALSASAVIGTMYITLKILG